MGRKKKAVMDPELKKKLSAGARRGPKIYRGRKLVTTVTVTQEHVDMVQALGEGKSWSSKLRFIIEEFAWRRETLVQYKTLLQKENGTPEMIVRDAERIYSCSAFQNGWILEGRWGRIAEAAVYKAWDDGKLEGDREAWRDGKPSTIEFDLVPIWKEMGMVVQVVNHIDTDLYDVWISGRGWVQNDNCKICPRLERIRAAIRDPIDDLNLEGLKMPKRSLANWEPTRIDRTLEDIIQGDRGDPGEDRTEDDDDEVDAIRYAIEDAEGIGFAGEEENT